MRGAIVIAALAVGFWAGGLRGACAEGLELVMVHAPHCPACLRWEREVGQLYGRTEEAQRAPLRRVALAAMGSETAALAEPVRYTPTFLIVAGGRERGRITGYNDDAAFWGLLQALLRREGRD